MTAKAFAFFSAVVLSGLMAQASVLGTWHSDSFVLTDSEGSTTDQGGGTLTLSVDGDQLVTNFAPGKLTIKEGQLWSGEIQVGTITDSAVVVEHMISDDGYNDDYSFSVSLNSEDEAAFTDHLIYGDEPGYWDGFEATMVRQARSATAPKFELRNNR